jgi:hypothetical protein
VEGDAQPLQLLLEVPQVQPVRGGALLHGPPGSQAGDLAGQGGGGDRPGDLPGVALGGNAPARDEQAPNR